MPEKKQPFDIEDITIRLSDTVHDYLEASINDYDMTAVTRIYKDLINICAEAYLDSTDQQAMTDLIEKMVMKERRPPYQNLMFETHAAIQFWKQLLTQIAMKAHERQTEIQVVISYESNKITGTTNSRVEEASGRDFEEVVRALPGNNFRTRIEALQVGDYIQLPACHVSMLGLNYAVINERKNLKREDLLKVKVIKIEQNPDYLYEPDIVIEANGVQVKIEASKFHKYCEIKPDGVA